MSVYEAESVADVICTAVAYGPWGALVLSGVGSRLKGFHAERSTQVLNSGILQGCRIHGIAVHHVNDSDSPLLAIYGTRQLALLQLSWQASQQRFSVTKVAHVTQLPHWVLQAEITECHHSMLSCPQFPVEAAEAPGIPQQETCDVVLGLMDNSVELWTFTPPQGPSLMKPSTCTGNSRQAMLWQGARVARVECESRLLLYSLRLTVIPPADPVQTDSHAMKIAVASGTIFHDILLWTAEFPDHAATPPGTTETSSLPARSVPPAHTLRGHSGSILRLRWACGGRLLLSAADDRTARVWRMPPLWPQLTTPAPAAANPDMAPIMTLWGHAARVWDVDILGSLILTAAEDGDVRAWDGHTGAPLAAMHAHQGRGAWCMSHLPPASIATGGGDCALKLWHLPGTLPPPAAAVLLQPLDPDAIGPRQAPTAAAADPAAAAEADAQLSARAPATLQCTTRMPEALAARGARAARAHGNSSECISALALSSSTRLYAATSLGRVLRVNISLSQRSCDADWAEVCDVSAGGIHLSCCAAQPLHAMGACMQQSGDGAAAAEISQQGKPCGNSNESAVDVTADVTVVGSRQGSVTFVRVPVANPDDAGILAQWNAPAGGVLSVYLLESLPPGHLLCSCADSRLWWLFVSTLASAGRAARSTAAAAAPTPHEFDDSDAAPSGGVVVAGWCAINQKNRIAEVDVVPTAGLAVVGDSVGGLTGFAVPEVLMRARTEADVRAAMEDAAAAAGGEGEGAADEGGLVAREFAAVCRFGKCHGTQPVTMVAAVGGCVYTGGRNGAALPARLPQHSVVADMPVWRWVVCKWDLPVAAAQAIGRQQRHAVGIQCVTELRVPGLSGVVGIAQTDEQGPHGRETLLAGFRSSEFRLWDSERDVEHLAVASGGWRRPFALCTTSSREFTVALLKEQAIRIICRRGLPGGPEADGVREDGAATGPPPEAASLLRTHHGRIVLACACFRLGSDHVAAVSASEDGTVRALVFRCDKSSPSGLHLVDTMLLGKLITGAAARCLSALPLHPPGPGLPQWLLISGGAREVQAAWTLTPPPATPASTAPGPPSAPAAQWLATRAPAAGLRPKRTPNFSSMHAQLRTLALTTAAAPGIRGVCGVLEAPSGGGLQLGCFDTSTRAWAPCAMLQHHRFVVLSLATTTADGRVLAASGGSDGCIALWDITETLTHAAERMRSGTAEQEGERVLRPVLVLDAQHQSGVNAVQLLAVDGMLCAVSGGDDQLLRATVLRCNSGGSWAASDSASVPCAHASAIKGLGLRAVRAVRAGPVVLQCCSVGWDQYVRVWQISMHERGEGGAADAGEPGCTGGLAGVDGREARVREVLRHAVDVSEPAGLAGCTSDCGRWQVFVSGRGSQMLTLDVPLL